MKLKLSKHNRVIIGIALITFSVLLFFSIISYRTTDYDPSTGFTDNIENLMGRGGALISFYLITGTFGFSTIVLSVLLFLSGWQTVRQKKSPWFNRLALYSLFTMFLVSYGLGIVGEFSIGGSTSGYEYSGLIGGFFANFSAMFLGKAGTIIIYIALLLILLVLWSKFKIWTAFEFVEKYLKKIWKLRKKLVRGIKGLKKEIKKKRKEFEIARKEKDDKELQEEIDREIQIKLKKKHSPPPDETTEVETKIEPKRPPKINLPRQNLSSNPLDKYSSQQESLEYQDEKETKIDIKPEKQKPVFDDPGVSEDEGGVYQLPPLEFLVDPPVYEHESREGEITRQAEILETTLLDFGVQAKVVEVHPGPVLTLYEIRPSTGVKISRILSLQDDIALAMKARGIRLIAPIPGKDTVGVEIPNQNPETIFLKDLLIDPEFKKQKSMLTVALGRTISGEVYYADLAQMPHLLIAGQTGSGKSVGVNTIINSILYNATPQDVQFILIDPKMVELSFYNKLHMHHLLTADFIDEKVITKPQNAVLVLKALVNEMEKRYELMAKNGVRNIVDYNNKTDKRPNPDTGEEYPEKLEYIVVIVDELADLMLVAQKDIEEPIARIAQMARAVGIHVVLATQRPSVDVITGFIKSNFSARLAYRVFSKTDSRTILDMNGADTLLGKGDMLFLPPGVPSPIRLQNAFLSTEEVEKVVDHVSRQPKFVKTTELKLHSPKSRNALDSGSSINERDTLFEDAAKIIVTHQQGSISLLQRRLKIGYSRAARLVDEMEEAGIVGPYDGSKARQVLIDEDDLEDHI